MQQMSCRITLFLTLLCTTGCFSDDSAQLGEVVNAQGEVTSQIKELLAFTHVESDGTLSDTVKQTQKYWLRKPGQERWDIEQYITGNESQIRAVFNDLGMVKAIQPNYQIYDYVFILGATFHAIKHRLNYVIQLFRQGFRFKNLIFLGGARPVMPARGENMSAYLTWIGAESIEDPEPATEAEVMKLVYKYIDMPAEMRSLPVQFIDVPMIVTDTGTRRPATEDIINGWLVDQPVPGRCLFISSQPYVGFQDAVVKTYMPQEFTVDTIGPESKQEMNIGIILDNVARWLYQEGKRLDNKK